MFHDAFILYNILLNKRKTVHCFFLLQEKRGLLKMFGQEKKKEEDILTFFCAYTDDDYILVCICGKTISNLFTFHFQYVFFNSAFYQIEALFVF